MRLDFIRSPPGLPNALLVADMNNSYSIMFAGPPGNDPVQTVNMFPLEELYAESTTETGP